MNDQETKDYLFRTLTPEEYKAAPVPSREEIREALRKGSEDLRKAMAAPKPRRKTSGIFFR